MSRERCHRVLEPTATDAFSGGSPRPRCFGRGCARLIPVAANSRVDARGCLHRPSSVPPISAGTSPARPSIRGWPLSVAVRDRAPPRARSPGPRRVADLDLAAASIGDDCRLCRRTRRGRLLRGGVVTRARPSSARGCGGQRARVAAGRRSPGVLVPRRSGAAAGTGRDRRAAGSARCATPTGRTRRISERLRRSDLDWRLLFPDRWSNSRPSACHGCGCRSTRSSAAARVRPIPRPRHSCCRCSR